MPASDRKITPADLIDDADYARERKQRRAALLPIKRLRRIALGPICTVYFENYQTMLFQVQEMLITERGGPAQVAVELAAYNPMIPQGAELTATVMFEIDEPVRRDQTLRQLGGVEDDFFLRVGDEEIAAVPEGDIERTRDDGKTSSVHFLRFALTPAQMGRFNDPATTILIGCRHEAYGHLAMLNPATRAELAKDFA